MTGRGPATTAAVAPGPAAAAAGAAPRPLPQGHRERHAALATGAAGRPAADVTDEGARQPVAVAMVRERPAAGTKEPGAAGAGTLAPGRAGPAAPEPEGGVLLSRLAASPTPPGACASAAEATAAAAAMDVAREEEEARHEAARRAALAGGRPAGVSSERSAVGEADEGLASAERGAPGRIGTGLGAFGLQGNNTEGAAVRGGGGGGGASQAIRSEERGATGAAGAGEAGARPALLREDEQPGAEEGARGGPATDAAAAAALGEVGAGGPSGGRAARLDSPTRSLDDTANSGPAAAGRGVAAPTARAASPPPPDAPTLTFADLPVSEPVPPVCAAQLGDGDAAACDALEALRPRRFAGARGVEARHGALAPPAGGVDSTDDRFYASSTGCEEEADAADGGAAAEGGAAAGGPPAGAAGARAGARGVQFGRQRAELEAAAAKLWRDAEGHRERARRLQVGAVVAGGRIHACACYLPFQNLFAGRGPSCCHSIRNPCPRQQEGSRPGGAVSSHVCAAVFEPVSS